MTLRTIIGRRRKPRGPTDQPLRARRDDLVTEALGDELLVYDLRSDRVHCLGADAARVWAQCDGTRTEAGVLGNAREAAIARQALAELAAADLLEAPPVASYSRREVTLRIAAAGAAVAGGAPLIRSIVAPTAAAAASCPPVGGACCQDSDCCDNMQRPGRGVCTKQSCAGGPGTCTTG